MLHLVLIYLILALPCITSTFQALQICVSSVPLHVTHSFGHHQSQLLVLFFSNEVHFSSWLLWTRASMPPGSWSYFGWSDQQSTYCGCFFPLWLVIHSCTLLRVQDCFSPFFLNKDHCMFGLHPFFVFIVFRISHSCILLNKIHSNVCVHKLCWQLLCAYLELHYWFVTCIQFLLIHVIVSLVFMLFVLHAYYHKRELFIQTSFIVSVILTVSVSEQPASQIKPEYKQWFTVWHVF